jgi:hypothetical protein
MAAGVSSAEVVRGWKVATETGDRPSELVRGWKVAKETGVRPPELVQPVGPLRVRLPSRARQRPQVGDAGVRLCCHAERRC